jgi:galactokinase
VNAPASPKSNPLHTRLAQIGDMAKALETKADRELSYAHLARKHDVATREQVAARRAKVARRDEKRLAKVVAWQDEQDCRAAVRRERATA